MLDNSKVYLNLSLTRFESQDETILSLFIMRQSQIQTQMAHARLGHKNKFDICIYKSCVYYNLNVCVPVHREWEKDERGETGKRKSNKA